VLQPIKDQITATRTALRVQLPAGVALTVYFSMGLFGASLFGQDTEGNIMVNELVVGRAATAALYGVMLLYLALGMTTTQYALRASLDLMVFGEDATFTWTRQVRAQRVIVDA
jgi:hypothetical protein